MFKKIKPIKLCRRPLCSKSGFKRELKMRFNISKTPIKIKRKKIDFWVVVFKVDLRSKKVKREKDKIRLSNGINMFNKVFAGKILLEISDFGASISGINVPTSVPVDIPNPHGVNIS